QRQRVLRVFDLQLEICCIELCEHSARLYLIALLDRNLFYRSTNIERDARVCFGNHFAFRSHKSFRKRARRRSGRCRRRCTRARNQPTSTCKGNHPSKNTNLALHGFLHSYSAPTISPSRIRTTRSALDSISGSCVTNTMLP